MTVSNTFILLLTMKDKIERIVVIIIISQLFLLKQQLLGFFSQHPVKK